MNPKHSERYTAHLVLALLVIIWVCFVLFLELKAFLKIRQDYLTSAEHRLRASATTVLVTAIPKKWLSKEALSGLFDVFPGGVRNIWLNRDLTRLLDKVSLRDSVHRQLESAETALIKRVKKAQSKQQRAEKKKRAKELHLEALKEEQASRDKEQDAEAGPHPRASERKKSGHERETPHSLDGEIRGSCVDIESAKTPQRLDSKGPNSASRVKPVQKMSDSLDGIVEPDGTLADGAADAVAPTRGFVNPACSRATAAGGISPPISSDLPEATRAASPGASVNTSSSTRAIKKPHEAGHAMKNTVRKLDNIDQMYSHYTPRFWQFWKPPAGGYENPVPQGEDPTSRAEESARQPFKVSAPFTGPKERPVEYEPAFDCEFNFDDEANAEWAKYIDRSARPTHYLPLFGVRWLSGLPGVTKKVDTIYWCRRELARLNLEIEHDQKHPERFPLMTSAFIQFNHQIAAHMACQSVVHHLPSQMGPRTIEISPRDVLWGNMAINWWQGLLRATAVATLLVFMIALWGIPVAWTAALGQSQSILGAFHADKNTRAAEFIKSLSGVLPAIILGLVLLIVPCILNVFASFSGAKTGAEKAEFVQKYYFMFLFVQVFLVISIASFFSKSIQTFIDNFANLKSVSDVLNLLARDLPSAAVYFFSYLILQALAVSSGTLAQIGPLLIWFIWAPMVDSTARSKWLRNTSLMRVDWGSLFPIYTNFACIGIIYCIVAPLISIFMVIVFSLLWIAQRYAMLYVNRSGAGTGGILYPRAINQTFTGLYVMELCLAGLFFLVQDENRIRTCTPHGAIMIGTVFLTAFFQIKLHSAFSPLTRYLPITFEDEAVLRDEAFQRAQDARFDLIPEGEGEEEAAEDEQDDLLDANNRENPGQNPNHEHGQNIEMHDLDSGRSRPRQLLKPVRQVGEFAKAGGKQVGSWAKGGGQQVRKLKQMSNQNRAARYRRRKHQKDLEMQRAIGEALFGGVHDEIEDLTPDERDALTQHAFLHDALRARRPAVWIPRDDLGVSDDEIRRTRAFSEYIWISNEGAALNAKNRVVYATNPPDFSELDLIDL
ncbi:hypothetical protein AAL_02166 [Moelleriella libera RCEF 2490]|uniref:DUF221 domain-containing protein n=1 Tax=Moelleriella libera RCEF 2490 TaxID=1081109 RepID=A0A168F8I3_9HYPO|nr:hypothetical protein AAL_02166 [Moelleriella libera RCEF 2490]